MNSNSLRDPAPRGPRRVRIRAAASIWGRLSPISLARLPGRRPIQAREEFESAFAGELLAGDFRLREVGQRMADELGFDTVFAIERLFEGEDYQHLVDVLANELDALFFPGPELGAYEKDDGDAEAVEFFCEAEMDVGKVDAG